MPSCLGSAAGMSGTKTSPGSYSPRPCPQNLPGSEGRGSARLSCAGFGDAARGSGFAGLISAIFNSSSLPDPRSLNMRKGSRSNSSASRKNTAAICLHGLDQSGHVQSVSRSDILRGNRLAPASLNAFSMPSGIWPASRLAAAAGSAKSVLPMIFHPCLLMTLTPTLTW